MSSRLEPIEKTPPKRALGRNLRASQIRVTGQHIYWVYGQLVARLRRNVTWEEFSEMTGISPRMVRYLRFNEKAGSAATAKKLLQLRNLGLMIHLSDFLATPETQLDSLPVPGRRRKTARAGYSPEGETSLLAHTS